MRNTDRFKLKRSEMEKINLLADNEPLNFIDECENGYLKQLGEISQIIKDNIDIYKMVLLAGPTASGKTTTAHKLSEALAKKNIRAVVVSMDDFFKNLYEYPLLTDGNYDFESVYCMDIDMIKLCFNELLRSGESLFPRYDFTTGKRTIATHKIVISKGDILIIEGIHALNPIITDNLPQEWLYKILVSVRTKFIKGEEVVLAREDIRLIRRMVRDYNFRNYSIENTLIKWVHVLEAEKKYIVPYHNLVQYKIDSTLEYEPCVFMHYLSPIIKKSKIDLRFNDILKRIDESLDMFSVIDKSYIPSNSLLHEFIKD